MVKRAAYYGDKPEATGGGLAAGDISAAAPATWNAGTATVGVATGTGANQVALGNHTHAGLTADQAAGTASVRTLGTAATQAAPGDHTHPGLTADQAAGTASVRTLGTAATQAAPGNHTHSGLMTGSATAVNNTAASDVAGVVTAHNALLAALRTRGIITGA